MDVFILFYEMEDMEEISRIPTPLVLIATLTMLEPVLRRWSPLIFV